MSEEIIARSALWSSAFANRDDGRDKDRKELEQVLINFRRRTIPLLSLISRDMPTYTVHDIDHIDALWEVAEIIAGTEYVLNPAEAFVFGGALLLHDAGMTLAAYPGGIKDLRNTPTWQDNASSARRILAIPVETAEDDLLSNKDFLDFALTSTLRDLHGQVAESLAKQRWQVPQTSEQQFLLENADFRDFYGETIGQIAASHHWDVRQVIAILGIPLNAHPRHPSNWTVDKVKIALLLRCSDAAHIDARRAPRLLFSLIKPTGVAAQHWSFQAKIAKPRCITGKLRYTSNAAFEASEADAWQLAWDTIRMIDTEIGQASDILSQRGAQPFAVSGVDGAKSPISLADFIQVRGWTPVLPEIRVSDVAHLAKTLGGRDLYSREFTPLRELIQNAADSIEARVAIDSEFTIDEGRITIRIIKTEDSERTTLEIEDNGLGMSERVLTGPLIDFGTSFWKSSLARIEYPGLQGKFREPRGRYGIGFFSVFMWSNDVVVASRPFNGGRKDTKILQFTGGLGRRPILREANVTEELGSVSTRVRIIVAKETINRLFDPRFHHRDGMRYMASFDASSHDALPFWSKSWKKLIGLLGGLLETKIYVEEDGSRTLVNLPDWRSTDSERFIAFFDDLTNAGQGETAEKSEIANPVLRRAPERLSSIRLNGSIVGRALLSRNESSRRNEAPFIYEKGIFVSHHPASQAFGAIEGKTLRADREAAKFPHPHSDVEWTSEQERRVFIGADNLGEKIAAQQALINIYSYNEAQPLFILNREVLSLVTVVEKIHTLGAFSVSFQEEPSKAAFSWKIPQDLSVITSREVNPIRLYTLVDFHLGLSEDFAGTIEKIIGNTQPFEKIWQRLLGALGGSHDVMKTWSEVSSYDRRRSMRLVVRRTGN